MSGALTKRNHCFIIKLAQTNHKATVHVCTFCEEGIKMIKKFVIEIGILWVWFLVYMVIVTIRKGPVSALYFYPMEVGEKAISLGLTTRKEMKSRKLFALILLILGDFFIPYIMITKVNGANTFTQYFIQYAILFYGMEFFDWFFVDTLWVAKTNWWIISGLEDLNHLWHDPGIKKYKMLTMIPVSLIFALIFALLCMGLVRIW